MIASFKNKGLQELFNNGKTLKLPQERLKKIRAVLAVLDSAVEARDFNVPAYRLHKLKKPPLEGMYSIDISGNFRIVFGFKDGKVTNVDYLDTH